MEHLGWSLRALGCSGFELNSQEQWGDRKELCGGEWHGQLHAPGKGHPGCSVEEGRAASVRACFTTQPAGDKAGACEGGAAWNGTGKEAPSNQQRVVSLHEITFYGVRNRPGLTCILQHRLEDHPVSPSEKHASTLCSCVLGVDSRRTCSLDNPLILLLNLKCNLEF